MGKGLNGITVIDFTENGYGQIGSEYLALVGMNVIRVEKPKGADGPRISRKEFIANNLNKKCVTIDTDSDEGKALFMKLIDIADVLIENRTYGYMKQLGFDHETLMQRNPKLIYAAMRPYASGSPWEGCPAGEMVIEAVSGCMYLNGSNDREPLMPGVNMPDTSTCVYTDCAIVAALYERESTGKGQFIEVAQQNAMIAHSRSAYEVYHNTGKNTRSGNYFATMPGMVPSGVYKTKGDPDKEDANYIQMGASSDANFVAMCKVLGLEQLLDEPKYADAKGRTVNAEELDRYFNDVALKFTKHELMEKVLLQGRVPSGAVNSFEDLINDEDIRRSGTLQKVDDPETGEMWLPTFPAIYSVLEVKAEDPVCSGAGNEDVFKGFLGLTGEEYDRLKAAGVI